MSDILALSCVNSTEKIERKIKFFVYYKMYIIFRYFLLLFS